MGCQPKCAGHKTFALEMCDLTSCEKCNRVDDVNDISTEFIHNFYVEEILQTIKQFMAPTPPA